MIIWIACLKILFVSDLQICTFLRNNCTIDWTNLKANPAINASIKINPVEIGPFFIFALSRLNAGNRTGINTVSNSLTDVSDDCVCHR